MSTVDNINSNIISKILILEEILAVYNDYQLDPYDNKLVIRSIEDLDSINTNYRTGSMDILREYQQLTKVISTQTTPLAPSTPSVHSAQLALIDEPDKLIPNTSIELIPSHETLIPSTTSTPPAQSQAPHHEKRFQLYQQYIRFINIENILNKLNKVYSVCTKLRKIYQIDSDTLSTLFKKYDSLNITIDFNEKHTNICAVCHAPCKIESKTSEFVCSGEGCGSTEKIYGAVFEDEQFFFQEGQRTKHCKYDPNKQCRIWLDRILGYDSIEIPPDHIARIKNCVTRDNIVHKNLTNEMLREYFKEEKLTKYNNYTNLFKKIITGIEPEQLTDKEKKLVAMKFSLAVEWYRKIKPEEKTNCPYHPYFIYKIIEQLLDKPEDQGRKKAILSTIHLQANNTLIDNDLTWKTMCNHIAGFTYLPTLPS